MTERARILIVDDDPVIRLLAGSALTDVGHAVVNAEIAEAAIPCSARRGRTSSCSTSRCRAWAEPSAPGCAHSPLMLACRCWS
ncbi:hypothetical protein [Thauera humireducens]|uniref:hypothetical protein n=1 Tax=Thauera humireducens TaxID=1134435 RepID=UPI00311F995E